MSVYFKKINFSILSNLDNIRGDLLFKYNSTRYYNLASTQVINEINDKFLNNKPKNIFFVDVTNSLNPHIDQGVTSCMNYYINSSNYVTKFWEIKDIKICKKMITSRIEGNKLESMENRYSRGDLSLVTEFYAEDKSAYILNIGKIHSVDKTNIIDKSIRTMIQLQWYCNFNQLNDIIKNNLGDPNDSFTGHINII